LKNQNPLDPLDTNQFTQQLAQFAQMKSHDQLSSLVSLESAGDHCACLCRRDSSLMARPRS
ncbi:MAG: flagellar hook capping FlgD N-terminal domain-containing protein, partial [Pseudolabrys sp.]